MVRDRIRLYDDLSLGPTTKYINELLANGNNDNANMSYNPETLHKYTADATLKRYSLINMLPGHLAELHLNGDLHIHDLEYFPFRPMNCLQHDIRFFIRNGLKVDGNGIHTSASKPAKNLETLVNHAGQILGASQINMSGGQGLPALNVFMAPFVVGKDYKEIKQAMQMLIFNMNMSYVSRGGQAVFSTVGLEFDVPKFLQDEVAVGPGGKKSGVYAEYYRESELILKAFTEVLYEGDGFGKPHLFPNTVYRLTDDSFEHEELMDQVHELSSKFSAPYFSKQIGEEEYWNVMGCRTRLNSNWTGNPDTDCLRTGNLGYISLNLPRYALSGDFWEALDESLHAAKEILLLRLAHAEKIRDKGLVKFLTQKDENGDGSDYYRMENATLSFGIVGLNDCLDILEGVDITNKRGRKVGHQIVQYINDYAKKLQSETGLRWTVLQSPAESTAGRFATEDRRKYAARAPVHGERGGYYYTNSSHVPVDNETNLIERVQIEDGFHPECGGGHIWNAYMGEANPDPKALLSLTKKIYDNSDMGFWAYSGAYSICTECNTFMHGKVEQCCCGGTTDIYDRITGYMQKVSGWNKSKQSEFKDRRRHKL